MNTSLKKSLQISIVFLLIFSLSFFSFVKAEKATPDEAIKQVVGFNPEDIPTSPDQIKDKYLVKEWSDLISRNVYLGPAHNFLLTHQTLMKILFGDPYAISFTFLVIVLLWLFIGAKSGQLFEASGILKGGATIIAGFVFTVLLAQTTILRTIAKLCLDIITSSANWWIRFIAAIMLVFLFFIISYLLSIARKAMIENRAKKKEEKRDERDEELKALEKGIEK